jgi:hypothetical protein
MAGRVGWPFNKPSRRGLSDQGILTPRRKGAEIAKGKTNNLLNQKIRPSKPARMIDCCADFLFRIDLANLAPSRLGVKPDDRADALQPSELLLSLSAFSSLFSANSAAQRLCVRRCALA